MDACGRTSLYRPSTHSLPAATATGHQVELADVGAAAAWVHGVQVGAIPALQRVRVCARAHGTGVMAAAAAGAAAVAPAMGAVSII